jgi:hypothetical protein
MAGYTAIAGYTAMAGYTVMASHAVLTGMQLWPAIPERLDIPEMAGYTGFAGL